MAKSSNFKPKSNVTRELSGRSRARKADLSEAAARERISVPATATIPTIRQECWKISDLRLPERNVRKREAKHISELSAAISHLGFVVPAIITPTGQIIDGVNRIEAAKELGHNEVHCVVVVDASAEQVRLLRLAINRLGETGSWDFDVLKFEFEELILLDAPVILTGFSLPEIDIITSVNPKEVIDRKANKPVPANTDRPAISALGDIWRLGTHRVVCGDATDPTTYARLVPEGEVAQALFSDPPYNIKIDGFAVGAGSIRHREFAQAVGEMSDEEFTAFLTKYLQASCKYLADGSVLFVCMDWRHTEHVWRASRDAALEMLNMVVWSKTNAGLGGLYRSAHELVFVLKHGKTPHANNVQLGKHGRDRTNVWTYPGANSKGSSANTELKNHPTPKPVELLADAMQDVTSRGDLVLDPFLGSGTSLIAAEKSGRRVYAIELDPIYTDSAIRRWQTYTDKSAIHEGTGKTFDEMAAKHEPGVADAPPGFKILSTGDTEQPTAAPKVVFKNLPGKKPVNVNQPDQK